MGLKSFTPRALAAAGLVLGPLLAACTSVQPLHKAASSGDIAQVQALLAKGANVNARDIAQQTPLIWAACPCRPDMLRVLIGAGADVNARDSVFGKSALDDTLQCQNGPCEEAANILRAAGARKTSPAAASAMSAFGGGGLMSALLPGGMMARPAPAPETESEPAAQPAPEREPEQAPAPRAAPAAIVSAVDTPSYAATEDASKFALVIGIAKYRDIPEAEYADNDAKAVKRHLLALGYPEENIITLMGDRATKSTLEDKLERWLPMNVDSKSTVFVYYSGHGAPDLATQDAYLVPWDGDPSSLQATAFPLARFYKDLNKLPAKRVLVALDACFSGAGGRSVIPKGGRPLLTQIVTGFPDQGKVVAFTASGSDQISGTLERQGHGAFTYYFLRGLNGDAAAGEHVTVGSLYDYLSRNVSASAHRQEREQNPQLLPAQGDDRTIQLR